MEDIISDMEGIVSCMSPKADTVAQIVAQWGRERPDLDASPILVVGQIARLTQLFEPYLRPPFAAAGMGNGDFDVLAALRRSGEPFTLSPGDLSSALLVTTGAITKRLDRLERRGLLRREVSAEDGRGRLVTLTPRGVRLTDELIVTHLANEAALLDSLSPGERGQLVTLLAKLAAAVEDDTPSGS